MCVHLNIYYKHLYACMHVLYIYIYNASCSSPPSPDYVHEIAPVLEPLEHIYCILQL
jgi:hypothetical protein